MKDYIYSDLFFEDISCDFAKECALNEYSVCENEGIRVFKLKIENEKQSEKYRRPIGRYVTFSAEKFILLSNTHYSIFTDALSREIRNMIKSKIRTADSILVLGLGNPMMTADSLGDKTVERIEARNENAGCKIFTVATDVFSATGIQTLVHVKALTDATRASAVIAIDSLMSRSEEHLYSAVQLSDSGIAPGSGMGHTQAHINEDSVGVPVISVGVPAVVSAATLICDALRKAGINTLSDELREVLDGERASFVTSPDADICIRAAAMLLADSIQQAIDGI